MSVKYEELRKAITTVEVDMYENSRIEDYYLLNLQQSPYGDFKVEFLGIDIWEDDAALAYNEAAIDLCADFACLNKIED